MMILQLQFTQFDSEEYNAINDFCNYLMNIIKTKIVTDIFRKKVNARIQYLYNAQWMKWTNKYTTSDILINSIFNSLYVEKYRYNIYRIRIDTSTLVPNTRTSVDTLARFINYGDNKVKGTGVFTNIPHYLTAKRINSLWKVYAIQELHKFSDMKIIC